MLRNALRKLVLYKTFIKRCLNLRGIYFRRGEWIITPWQLDFGHFLEERKDRGRGNGRWNQGSEKKKDFQPKCIYIPSTFRTPLNVKTLPVAFRKSPDHLANQVVALFSFRKLSFRQVWLFTSLSFNLREFPIFDYVLSTSSNSTVYGLTINKGLWKTEKC